MCKNSSFILDINPLPFLHITFSTFHFLQLIYSTFCCTVFLNFQYVQICQLSLTVLKALFEIIFMHVCMQVYARVCVCVCTHAHTHDWGRVISGLCRGRQVYATNLSLLFWPDWAPASPDPIGPASPPPSMSTCLLLFLLHLAGAQTCWTSSHCRHILLSAHSFCMECTSLNLELGSLTCSFRSWHS